MARSKYYLNSVLYRIINIINGMSYVGLSINSFRDRYHGLDWWETVTNRHLKRELKKFGKEAFQIEIITYHRSKEELNALECIYADLYDSYYPNGYNIMKCGHSPGKRSRTPEPYVLNSPQGENVAITNVNEFCRDHKLDNRSIWRVIKGQYKSHKGWSQKNQLNKVHRQYIQGTLYDESGAAYQVTSLKHFAQAKNLSYESLKMMWYGHSHVSQGFAKRPDDFQKRQHKHRCVILINEAGQTLTITNVKKDSKTYKLVSEQLYKLINGKRSEYRGWKIQPS